MTNNPGCRFHTLSVQNQQPFSVGRRGCRDGSEEAEILTHRKLRDILGADALPAHVWLKHMAPWLEFPRWQQEIEETWVGGRWGVEALETTWPTRRLSTQPWSSVGAQGHSRTSRCLSWWGRIPVRLRHWKHPDRAMVIPDMVTAEQGWAHSGGVSSPHRQGQGETSVRIRPRLRLCAGGEAAGPRDLRVLHTDTVVRQGPAPQHCPPRPLPTQNSPDIPLSPSCLVWVP